MPKQETCPYCKAELIPESEFFFSCPNSDCNYHLLLPGGPKVKHRGLIRVGNQIFDETAYEQYIEKIEYDKITLENEIRTRKMIY